jgi:hypothetical protein
VETFLLVFPRSLRVCLGYCVRYEVFYQLGSCLACFLRREIVWPSSRKGKEIVNKGCHSQPAAKLAMALVMLC